MDTHIFRENDEQRDQEQALSGQGDQKPLPWIVGRGKIGDGYRLYILEEYEHHIDLEVFFREFKVQVRARP